MFSQWSYDLLSACLFGFLDFCIIVAVVGLVGELADAWNGERQ